jgi:hypothetical protein
VSPNIWLKYLDMGLTGALMKQIVLTALSISISLVILVSSYCQKQVIALPPAEDIPEEVLRTEIITAGRSPMDGSPLTASEYAEIELKLQESPPPELNPKIRESIFLLQIRQNLLKIFPFLKF